MVMLTGPCIMSLHLLTGNLDLSLLKVAPHAAGVSGRGGVSVIDWSSLALRLNQGICSP